MEMQRDRNLLTMPGPKCIDLSQVVYAAETLESANKVELILTNGRYFTIFADAAEFIRHWREYTELCTVHTSKVRQRRGPL